MTKVVGTDLDLILKCNASLYQHPAGDSAVVLVAKNAAREEQKYDIPVFISENKKRTFHRCYAEGELTRE